MDHLLRISYTDLKSLQRWIVDYLNSELVRQALGVDPESGNFSISSSDVESRFRMSGDPWHLAQLYVTELLARGIRVCFSTSLLSITRPPKKYLAGPRLYWDKRFHRELDRE